MCHGWYDRVVVAFQFEESRKCFGDGDELGVWANHSGAGSGYVSGPNCDEPRIPTRHNTLSLLDTRLYRVHSTLLAVDKLTHTMASSLAAEQDLLNKVTPLLLLQPLDNH